jgi:transposase InsO family protein
VNGVQDEQRRRRVWVELYAETNDAGLVCRRCGISRPTLRLWWGRFLVKGDAGLANLSRRPHHSPRRVLDQKRIDLILFLRDERKLGPKRIQVELLRHHDLRFSTATIWKVLHAHKRAPLVRRRPPESPRRYSRPLPGDRVQIDTMKIGAGRFQYTAIDDCTRLRVLGLYPRRTAINAAHFLEHRMVEEFPFPIQRVQTDRGGEFFGMAFQEALQQYCIKFRPNRPRSPHLNGKVERSQQTDWVEFYSTMDVEDPSLPDLLEEWQFFYNWHRPHSALGAKTPMERCCELLDATPQQEEVEGRYHLKHERAKVRDFSAEQRLAELKGCL